MKKKKPSRPVKIDSFDLQPGRIIARKYEVINKLGAGWEGEVYKIRELSTGIARAAKLFFPERNINNKTLRFYARKLHKLRHCPILIQYHTEEAIQFKKIDIPILVSEYVEGEILSNFLKRQPGKRIHPFQGLHLLHSLAKGFVEIHGAKEYHGDLHAENVIISRYGLGFDLKLLDMVHWAAPKKDNIQDDLCDMIRIFYDSIGGAKHYAKQPQEVKAICCGLKRTLILKRFRNVVQLCQYLETMKWK